MPATVYRVVLSQVSDSWWFSYPTTGDCKPVTEHRELPVMVLRHFSGSWWFSYPTIGDCALGTEQRELAVISAEITVKFR